MNIQPTTSNYSYPSFAGRNLHGLKIKSGMAKVFIPKLKQEGSHSQKSDYKFKTPSVAFMKRFIDFCESKSGDIFGITENADKIYEFANRTFELIA